MASHVRLYVNNKPVELIKSVVERNGTRAVDTGVFTLSRKYAVTKGDTFQYVQDVVSPKYLVGLWNMEHNTRDESGYDIDGDEATSTIHEGSFAKKANGYAYKNKTGNNGRVIKIPRSGQTANFDHLKLDGQFDIMILGGIYGGLPNNYTGYLLGKGSSSTSIQIKTSSTGTTDPMVITAVLIIGGSTYTLTGTTDVNKWSSGSSRGGLDNMLDFWWIRLKRDSNNLVSLMVGDNVEDTETVTGDFTTNDDLYIAGDRQGNNPLETGQYTAQVRIYSGYSLTDDEWKILRSARRPTEVMKFGGTVWKIDEKLTHKVCYCKGLSDKLHNATVTTGSNAYPTWTTGDADIVKNEYYDKDGRDIISDLLKVYDLGINLAVIEDKLNTVLPVYFASGSILDNVTLLHFSDPESNNSFHVTPRGTLFLEENDMSHSEILFRQGALSRFSNFGYDDTSLVTQLTLIGNVQTITAHAPPTRQMTASNWLSGGSTQFITGYGYKQFSNVLIGFPISCEVTHPNGTKLVNLHEKEGVPHLYLRVEDGNGDPIAAGTGEFKVDYAGKAIYLGDDPDGISGEWVTKFTYQNTHTSNGFHTKKGTNYDTLGNFSKTWHFPHFQGAYSLSIIASNIDARLGNLERRVTITVPTLINHIRENFKVKVVDPDHSVGTVDSSGTNNDTPISLSVKSMKFLYPEGQTIINCGEHMFDSFDLDKAFSEAHSQQKSNIIGNPA